MSFRTDAAAEYHRKGFNCAQAVACAFADEVSMSEEDLFRVLEGFGLGMGGTRGTCGAISGAVAILSLMNSIGPSDPANKASTYRLTREVIRRFEEKNGVSICGQLKGLETGTVIRSCPDCIADAAEILEQLIGERRAAQQPREE